MQPREPGGTVRQIDIDQLELIIREGLRNGASWALVEASVLSAARRMRQHLGGQPTEAEVQALLRQWRRVFPNA